MTVSQAGTQANAPSRPSFTVPRLHTLPGLLLLLTPPLPPSFFFPFLSPQALRFTLLVLIFLCLTFLHLASVIRLPSHSSRPLASH